jgi:AhpD family alkylhydroperoxidase
MQARLDLGKAPAGAYEAMAALDGYVKKSGFDPRLLHLVRMRASQINGCAYCLDMHSKDARAEGETEPHRGGRRDARRRLSLTPDPPSGGASPVASWRRGCRHP